MVKDVVVNLSVVEGRDPACDYALSVAHAFNAHLAGIAFAYDPVLAIAGEAMPPKMDRAAGQSGGSRGRCGCKIRRRRTPRRAVRRIARAQCNGR
jgi:hypothetical protein